MAEEKEGGIMISSELGDIINIPKGINIDLYSLLNHPKYTGKSRIDKLKKLDKLRKALSKDLYNNTVLRTYQ